MRHRKIKGATMKTYLELTDNWSLKKIPPAKKLALSDFPTDSDWLAISAMPAQVHDVLLDHKILPAEILVGWCESAEWIGEYDWLYRCQFSCDRQMHHYDLDLKGLDTVVDIYLNGQQITCHDDLFVSETVDVTAVLAEQNTLLLHFHNILDYVDSLDYPEAWHDAVLRWKLVRKPVHDFPPEKFAGSNYQGAYRYYSPIGVYDRVYLISSDAAQIKQDHIQTLTEQNLQAAKVLVRLDGLAQTNVDVRIRLIDPVGKEVIKQTAAGLLAGDGKWTAEAELPLANPQIWWPRGYGDHPLYTVIVELWQNGAVCDRIEKQVGFRHIDMPYSLGFVINGKKVRLWGGSMDPFQGYTHCWHQDRMIRLLDMIENANMNTLRIWGQGIPYQDSFYEEADRRGILIWQEFFLGFGGYPNDVEYRNKCKREARELILRLRHHTSLLMWCGGNETIMGSEFIQANKPVLGIEMLQEDFPALVAELDPNRYYHPSSPSGGEWANDPRYGDHHTYDCVWQYPYKEYPNLVSEHIRTAPPVMHSLAKIIRGELWPEGYDGRFLPGQTFPMPENWMERSHQPVQGHLKTGPYWEYYDADNAYDHIYRFAAAYAQEMRDGLERARMGGPDGNTLPEFRTKGHFSCKLNDTWPKVYCAVIDYFQEAFMPYYATLRGQSPVLVCFDIKDSIHLWLVNDTADDITGAVRFGLFDMEKNQFVLEEDFAVAMPQGESGIIYDLDRLHFFKKSYLLYARFQDEQGEWSNSVIDYCCVERQYNFPEARLSAKIVDDMIEITTDRFARCVEITGMHGTDPFGWLFSDNYFDLVPGEIRRVRILGKKQGNITLKPHYSQHKTTLFYHHG